MAGLFGKKKSDGGKAGKAVDITKVKTAGAAGTPESNPGIVASSVLQSGNISSMGLSKEEQIALVEKRNEIPKLTKILKYSSIVLFVFMFSSFFFLSADLSPNNQWLQIVGLDDNTGSTYKRISRENTDKKNQKAQIEADTISLQNRIANKIFGNHVETTDEIQATQRQWFSKLREYELTDEETGDIRKYKVVDFGYIDVIDYMIAYFEDRSEYKTLYFQKKAEASSSNDINSFLMQNDLELKSFAINENGASINIDAADVFQKVFTLGAEIVEVTNSIPIYKNGALRSFNKKSLGNGDSGINVSLRLELQNEEDEDLSDENFKYLKDWLKGSGNTKIPTIRRMLQQEILPVVEDEK